MSRISVRSRKARCSNQESGEASTRLPMHTFSSRARHNTSGGATAYPTPPSQNHFFPLSDSKSISRPSNLTNLPIQPRNLPQHPLTLLDSHPHPIAPLLRHDHISPLKPLAQHIHDLRRHIRNLRIPHVNQPQHRVEPLETLRDIRVQRSGQGCGDGERNERRDLLEVGWVDADEEVVEEGGLGGRLEPLEITLARVMREGYSLSSHLNSSLLVLSSNKQTRNLLHLHLLRRLRRWLTDR